MNHYYADPHFFHRRICEFTGRPYQSVPEMNAHLIRRWNDRVAYDDTVYLLGDFAFQLNVPGVLEIVRRLNGTIVLVPGNHDKCHPMNGTVKSVEWRQRYLSAGFDDVTPPTMQKMIAGRWVTLCHFPYEGDSHDEDRLGDWRPVDDGETFVVHGHVHGAWKQRGRQINVGADAWSGYPVPEQAVADLILAGPADSDPEPWQSP